MSEADHKAAFIAAMRGVPANHVIAAINLATPGIEWRHCSKSHIAQAYASVMAGRRVSLSLTANEALRAIDLAEVRQAALERGHGNPAWHHAIEATMREALGYINSKQAEKEKA